MRKNLAAIGMLGIAGAMLSADLGISAQDFPELGYRHNRVNHGSPMKYGQKPTKNKTLRYHKRKAKHKRRLKMKNK